MDQFILVPYELQGKEGKIIVREGTPEEQIREYCVIDIMEKSKDKLKEKVNIKRRK